MNIDDILSRLEKVRANANGTWTARCPAHPDKTPSLAIAQGTDGRILLHCFSGCAIDEIVEAIGFRLPDIMPQERPAPLKFKRKLAPADVLEAMALNAMIVAITAADMAKGKQLSEDERDKLLAISGEFQEAIELTGATRMRDKVLNEVRRDPQHR